MINRNASSQVDATLDAKLRLTSPTQKQGERYEQLACAYLQQQGLTLVATNWLQAKIGELDLVMIEQGKAWDTLVFVEVRGRKQSGYGTAMESITPAKQRKLIKTAECFLQAHPEYADYECRFDVVCFDGVDSNPDWIQGAFFGAGW